MLTLALHAPGLQSHWPAQQRSQPHAQPELEGTGELIRSDPFIFQMRK